MVKPLKNRNVHPLQQTPKKLERKDDLAYDSFSFASNPIQLPSDPNYKKYDIQRTNIDFSKLKSQMIA